jgi:hypothetical protein
MFTPNRPNASPRERAAVKKVFREAPDQVVEQIVGVVRQEVVDPFPAVPADAPHLRCHGGVVPRALEDPAHEAAGTALVEPVDRRVEDEPAAGKPRQKSSRLVRRFEHADREAGPGQERRRDEPAHAGADDRDVARLRQARRFAHAGIHRQMDSRCEA